MASIIALTGHSRIQTFPHVCREVTCERRGVLKTGKRSRSRGVRSVRERWEHGVAHSRRRAGSRHLGHTQWDSAKASGANQTPLIAFPVPWCCVMNLEATAVAMGRQLCLGLVPAPVSGYPPVLRLRSVDRSRESGNRPVGIGLPALPGLTFYGRR